jgi:RNA polymerase subunit RPABC4/transcription elongation factor Spt4
MRNVYIIIALSAAILLFASPAFAGDNDSTAPAKMQCPKCGKDMDGAWKFCPFDGSALENACPKCGRIFPASHKFCPFDGADLSKNKQGESAVKPENASASAQDNASSTASKQDPQKGAGVKTPEGGVTIENKKPAPNTTAASEFRNRLSNPQTAAESVVEAVIKKDRRYLETAVLWTLYSDFYQKTVPPEKKLPVDEFKKTFLSDILKDMPAGLASEFAFDFSNCSVEAEAISMETSTAVVVLALKQGKTIIGKIEMAFRSIEDLWLVSSMRGEKERAAEPPRPKTGGTPDKKSGGK